MQGVQTSSTHQPHIYRRLASALKRREFDAELQQHVSICSVSPEGAAMLEQCGCEIVSLDSTHGVDEVLISLTRVVLKSYFLGSRPSILLCSRRARRARRCMSGHLMGSSLEKEDAVSDFLR